MYCINCGKHTHITKYCKDPRISYGVILIYIDKLTLSQINVLNTNLYKINNGIHIDSELALTKFNKYKDSIKFLMVQRKHTLGLLEFIRGNYDIANSESISHLFKQMTFDEIKQIRDNSFDDLWINIYGGITNYETLFNESKIKFTRLKTDVSILKLDFYLNNILPDFKTQEWGFPKGRRNKYESDYDCALREFYEETLFKNDVMILDKIEPIEENLIGTNGVHYKHIYYVGITLTNSLVPCYNSPEINDVKFFNVEDAVEIVRPYHYDKKSIIIHLYEYILNTLINN